MADYLGAAKAFAHAIESGCDVVQDSHETGVAGVNCGRLLMSNDYADFQLWIVRGDQSVLSTWYKIHAT